MKKFFTSIKNGFMAFLLFLFLSFRAVCLEMIEIVREDVVKPFEQAMSRRARQKRLNVRLRRIKRLKFQRWLSGLKSELPTPKIRPGFKKPKKIHHPRGQPFFQRLSGLSVKVKANGTVETRPLTPKEKKSQARARRLFRRKVCHIL